MDDLVYSGAGSGCNHDDEDQCTVTFDTGSGEYLRVLNYGIKCTYLYGSWNRLVHLVLIRYLFGRF